MNLNKNAPSGEEELERSETFYRELADRRAREISRSLAFRHDGECVGCGCEIEPERRAALPSALRCIDCQADVEYEERRADRL